MVELIVLIVLATLCGVFAEIISMINYRKYNGKEGQLELVSCEFFLFFVLTTILGIYTAISTYEENIVMTILSFVPIAVFFVLPAYCIISNNINKSKVSEEQNVKV